MTAIVIDASAIVAILNNETAKDRFADATLARTARESFLRFGKGRHSARLNFGDCTAYALAANNAVPPLFKGEGFTKTSVLAAFAAN